MMRRPTEEVSGCDPAKKTPPANPTPPDDAAQSEAKKLDRALDEALEETFPASDPVGSFRYD